eukprot:GEZU01021383.1.p1 GENE.GEZU01021383.1~~GEZU01021383.1.p1  ORF type:complete len:107 (-),score=27.55 GEZU01021383.1:43-363(-)
MAIKYEFDEKIMAMNTQFRNEKLQLAKAHEETLQSETKARDILENRIAELTAELNQARSKEVHNTKKLESQLQQERDSRKAAEMEGEKLRVQCDQLKGEVKQLNYK